MTAMNHEHGLCGLTSSCTQKLRLSLGMSLWFVSKVLVATETQRVSSLS